MKASGHNVTMGRPTVYHAYSHRPIGDVSAIEYNSAFHWQGEWTIPVLSKIAVLMSDLTTYYQMSEYFLARKPLAIRIVDTQGVKRLDVQIISLQWGTEPLMKLSVIKSYPREGAVGRIMVEETEHEEVRPPLKSVMIRFNGQAARELYRLAQSNQTDVISQEIITALRPLVDRP